jgi:hypothetical protein
METGKRPRGDRQMTARDIRDYAARFDISRDECERIAARCETEAEFVAIWENETWWTDQNSAA